MKEQLELACLPGMKCEFDIQKLWALISSRDNLIAEADDNDPELRFLLEPRENISGLLSEVILPALNSNEPAYDTFYQNNDHANNSWLNQCILI